MDDVLDFLKSKYGKILIGLVAVAIVLYGVKYFLDKKKYGGQTKSQLEASIKDFIAVERLNYFQANDPAVAEIGLYEVAYWWDLNRPTIIDNSQFERAVTSLKIDPSLLGDFQHLVGSTIPLVDYV